MGFDLAVPAPPLEDADLDTLLQFTIAGVTQLPGSLVRPRWQNPPPKSPEATVDWCAIGVMNSKSEGFPYITHASGPNITDPSADYYSRHEEMDVLASFYGPHAKGNAGLLRDGIAIPQNMEALNTGGLVFVDMGPIRILPDLLNQTWVRRCDTLLRFRRQVQRVYSMPNIQIADIHLLDDSGHVNRTILAPTGAAVVP
jgi:hypothetical protein